VKIADLFPSAILLFAGDVNKLDTSFLDEAGLHLLPTVATHGPNVLDKIFISNPNLYAATVCKSVLKTKHLAVLAIPCMSAKELGRTVKKVVTLYDFREPHVAALRREIASTDFYSLVGNDLVRGYSTLINCIKNIVSSCIPCKRIVMKDKDPPFMTPLIKDLLAQRCRLRRSGRIIEANSLAVKINSLIFASSKTRLSNCSMASPKSLWRELRDKSQPSAHLSFVQNTDPNLFNRFFVVHPLTLVGPPHL
jgi:hypothetical protein